MKSGLRDRNNQAGYEVLNPAKHVSMKSGLRDRNNEALRHTGSGVGHLVSMKSGLGDRNNAIPTWSDYCS